LPEPSSNTSLKNSVSQNANGIATLTTTGAVPNSTARPVKMPAIGGTGGQSAALQIYSDIPFANGNTASPTIPMQVNSVSPQYVQVNSSVAPEIRTWIVGGKSWQLWISDPNNPNNTVTMAYSTTAPAAIQLQAQSPFSSVAPFNVLTLSGSVFYEHWVTLLVGGQKMNCFDYVAGGLITIING
jgi:hypothetical protein